MIDGPVSALPTFRRPIPTTMAAAIAQEWKPANKWRRFAKLGDSITMVKDDRSVDLVFESDTEMRALGYRFPFERHGQWSSLDTKTSDR